MAPLKPPPEASSDASPKADAEATSSDGQKLEEIYTGSEEVKKASSVPVDTEEVKKTTELVNSYENILTKIKAAPSAAPSLNAPLIRVATKRLSSRTLSRPALFSMMRRFVPSRP